MSEHPPPQSLGAYEALRDRLRNLAADAFWAPPYDGPALTGDLHSAADAIDALLAERTDPLRRLELESQTLRDTMASYERLDQEHEDLEAQVRALTREREEAKAELAEFTRMPTDVAPVSETGTQPARVTPSPAPFDIERRARELEMSPRVGGPMGYYHLEPWMSSSVAIVLAREAQQALAEEIAQKLEARHTVNVFNYLGGSHESLCCAEIARSHARPPQPAPETPRERFRRAWPEIANALRNAWSPLSEDDIETLERRVSEALGVKP